MKKILFKLSKFIPDKLYLQLMYYKHFHKFINFKNPQTFNEKLQWLKLYDRKPIYTTMVDKYAAKQYVADIIGEEHIIPTLGVWNSFDQINFDELPNQFVLKWNHDSGSVFVCKDKSILNKEEVFKKLKKGIKTNGFYYGREWPYKNVKPKIIAEKYMVDESNYELKDYKIFCFNGKPEYVEVDFNRAIKHKLNTYDFEWNPLNFCDTSKNDYAANINKPKSLEKMIELAKVLSNGMKFLRVDFYEVKGKPYVGELTLYPGSGFIEFSPSEVDLKYGKLLDINKDN